MCGCVSVCWINPIIRSSTLLTFTLSGSVRECGTRLYPVKKGLMCAALVRDVSSLGSCKHLSRVCHLYLLYLLWVSPSFSAHPIKVRSWPARLGKTGVHAMIFLHIEVFSAARSFRKLVTSLRLWVWEFICHWFCVIHLKKEKGF